MTQMSSQCHCCSKQFSSIDNIQQHVENCHGNEVPLPHRRPKGSHTEAETSDPLNAAVSTESLSRAQKERNASHYVSLSYSDKEIWTPADDSGWGISERVVPEEDDPEDNPERPEAQNGLERMHRRKNQPLIKLIQEAQRHGATDTG